LALKICRYSFDQRYLVFTFLLLSFQFVTTGSFAQIGGKKSFQFVTTPVSSRLVGTGGVNVSLSDRDVNYFFSNPALNGDTLLGVASAGYQFYVGDIGQSSAVYAADINNIGMITFGVQHIGYGSIDGYDDTGSPLGSFNAQETLLNIGKSHQIGNYRLGVSLKGIFSNLAGYRANAVAVDIGGLFQHPTQSLTVGIVIKNAGVVFSDYSNTANSSLPFDVQVGTTFKPTYMPLRFSLTAYNLVTPNATYDDPAIDQDGGSTVKDIFNHLNFGAEVLLHKNANVLVGYNFLNHNALKLDQGGGGAGLTVGLALQIKKIEMVVSRAAYVAGNAVYSFTLSGNVNNMLKRK
jgi:hypothetical protein